MKFTRRPDLDPQTRIQIVMTAWLHQGVYGKMTQIAQYYQISRTFLYQLLFVANLHLETLFSDEKLLFQKEHRHLEQLILLLRLEGKCSILSIASMLKALEYHPNSVGYLSQSPQCCAEVPPLSAAGKTGCCIHMKFAPATSHVAPLTRAARRFSTSSWPQIGRLRLGARILKRLRHTSSFALGWLWIGAWDSWPATRPRAIWRCGWPIISTSFATSARCSINWSAKPLPPLVTKTTRRTSVPVPRVRPLFKSVSTVDTAHDACEQAMALSQLAMLPTVA